MPFPLAIVAAVAVVSAVSSGVYAAYKYYADDDEPKKEPEDEVVNLGRFALWGHPNVGKTTFIEQLLGNPITPEKIQTTGQVLHENISIELVNGKKYIIKEVIDMPGAYDRLRDWLQQAVECDNVFYLIDLSRWCDHEDSEEYIVGVNLDIDSTIETIINSKGKKNRINVVFSHLDRSSWKSVSPAQVVNLLHRESNVRMLYEKINNSEIAGYIYAANLTDNNNFKILLRDIVGDSHA